MKLSISDALRSVSAAVVSRMQPRTKRLLFLGSLVAKVEGTETFNKDTIQKLNKLMALSHEPQALQVPSLLSKVIWRGRETTELLGGPLGEIVQDDTRLEQAATSVLSMMPSYLKYASVEETKKDIDTALRACAV